MGMNDQSRCHAIADETDFWWGSSKTSTRYYYGIEPPRAVAAVNKHVIAAAIWANTPVGGEAHDG